MSKVYHKLFVHLVWSTYSRQALITPEIERVVFPFMDNKAKRFKCKVLCVGGIEDHIHIALRLSPSKSVSDIVGKLKGSSSYFLNKELQITKNFGWQDGYGALTFAERDLPKISKYILNQKEHHQLGRLNEAMEYIPEPEELDDEFND